MVRSALAALFLTLVVALAATATSAECVGRLAEHHPPPAVRGMSTDDPGFLARYWAWDDLNRRRGGQDAPALVDTGHGVLLAELDWSNADVCLDGGPVGRTAVLLEALDADGWGVWALVNLGADAGGDVDVDAAQKALGQVWSHAVPVPQPTIESLEVDPERVVVHLRWALDPAGEALSDLEGDLGCPLPSVRGFAVYVVNGPQATPRPWDWSFAADTEPDAANGFSTDTSATVVIDRGLWPPCTVCFGIALTFDGNGDAQGELPDSRSVHGQHLGAPSPWVALPPPGVDVPVGIVDLEAHLLSPGLLDLAFTGQAEPPGASYRLWAVRPGAFRRILRAIPGGAGSYDLELELPRWCRGLRCRIELEMLDSLERVVDTEVVRPR